MQNRLFSLSSKCSSTLHVTSPSFRTNAVAWLLVVLRTSGMYCLCVCCCSCSDCRSTRARLCGVFVNRNRSLFMLECLFWIGYGGFVRVNYAADLLRWANTLTMTSLAFHSTLRSERPMCVSVYCFTFFSRVLNVLPLRCAGCQKAGVRWLGVRHAVSGAAFAT